MWHVTWFTASGATFWICMHKHADSQEVQLLLPVRWHSMLFWQKKMRFFWECLPGWNHIIVLFLELLFWTLNMFLIASFFFFVHLWFKNSGNSLYFALVGHKISWPESHSSTSEVIVFVDAAAIYVTPITKCLAQVVL